jgi:hypothetical protein
MLDGMRRYERKSGLEAGGIRFSVQEGIRRDGPGDNASVRQACEMHVHDLSNMHLTRLSYSQHQRRHQHRSSV